MRVRISSKASILSTRAFSTLRIFPRRGRMAWNSVSRPPFADPPAESPSTMKISLRSTSLVVQSASLEGMPPLSSALFRRVSSRALRAASRACAARTPLLQIRLASVGCSSSQAPKRSATTWPTKGSASTERSRSLGWLLNWGSGCLNEMTTTRPSRRSSPAGAMSLMRFCLRAYELRVRVSEFLNPVWWVPPEGLKILLVKQSTVSL